MENKLFLLLMLFCILQNTDAGNTKNRKYSFKQITIEQGLSQSTVTCMLRDSRGSMWIGTGSGLNCFDKSEVKCYFNEWDNPTSISGNYIHTITEDAKGNVLISTENGLALYNPANNAFTTLTKDKIYSSIRLREGILFGCEDYLIHYHEESDEMEKIDLSETINPYHISYSKIIGLKLRDINTLIILTSQMGIFMYDLKSQVIRKMEFDNISPAFSLYIDPSGKYYIGCYNKGMYVYDENARFLAQYTTANSGLSNNIVMDIIEMDGRIWIATDGGGLNILDPATNEITTIQHVNGDKNSLPVNSITLLYKDKNDLWAGTVRGGAICIKESYISNYTDVVFNSGNGVSEKAIISLFEDKDTLLWIGTDGGGINCYNPSTNRFKHFENTYWDKVVSLTQLSENELLVSLFGRGLFSFHKQTGAYQRFVVKDQETENAEIAGYMPLVHSMCDHKIYIFTRTILVYDTRTKDFYAIRADEDVEIPPSLRLMYNDGTHCFAAGEHEIFSLHVSQDSIRPVLKMKENEIINTLSYDNDSLLWIGTNHGLSHFNIYTRELARVETRLFNTVSYLIHDEYNRLWICGENRLYSYLSDEKRFIVWSEADGFFPNEILFMFQPRSRTGNIYLGGTNGLVIIDKEIQLPENISPDIFLRTIELNGKSRLPATEKKIIKVPYNYASLSIVADVNEGDLFRNILFRYTIKGNTESWHESYSHSLNLPSLSPGKYTIWVSCNTKSGDWTPEKELIVIEITPPWYKMPFAVFLFIITGILLVTVFIIGLFRRKQKNLIRKMRIQERQMNESKIQFLINISHELRTPLTLIYTPLRRLMEKPLKEQNTEIVEKTLTNIFKQTDMMKNMVNMTLDISKLDEGISSITLSSQDMKKWIRKVADDFTEEYREKDIKLIYVLDEEIGVIDFDEAKCTIILSNLLMNTLKFSPSGSSVVITTQKTGDKIRISVTDQGIGFGHAEIDKLFTRFYQGKHSQKGTGIGLYYARQLAEAQGGTIGAYNNPDEGATFYFEIPAHFSSGENNPDPEENPAVMEIIQPDYDFSSRSILIVEDNEDLCSFLTDVMKPLFREVYITYNGEKGLEKTKEMLPDLILSDVMMPGMNGFIMCKQVKEDIRISHIPIVLLTAKGDHESMSTGYKLGADAYLLKPFQTDTLLAVIHNILKSREDIRQLYARGETDIPLTDVTNSPADEQFMLKLNKLIEENIQEGQLTVDFLTEHIGMGRTTFYNKLKILTGMGVNDYIRKIRINRACLLLITTEKDITEIAYEVGFTYQRYFSTLFRKTKGVSPTVYRNTYKK